MKKELRKKYLTIRNNIHSSILDNKIYNQVINDKDILNSKLLLIYVSYNNEVDTYKIIKYFLNKKKIAIPRIENDTMNFYLINSLNDLHIGYHGIMEPITNELVTNFKDCVSITPGICFSYDLYRIGYGKGYYDKFYSKYNNIYKIGLTYNECLVSNIPNNDLDIPVDKIITESNILVKKVKK